jgi:hypothetical protein
MRTLIASLAVALMMAGSAYAEDGAVSKDTLASFGLGGMQQMTDAQGTQVRGKFVAVWGNSHSSLFGTTSNNGYWGGGNFQAAAGNSFAQSNLSGNGSFVFNHNTTSTAGPNTTNHIDGSFGFSITATALGNSSVAVNPF